MTLARDLDEALTLLGSARDVLEERPQTRDAPGWVASRAWAGFLESLDDETLFAAETDPAAFLQEHGPPDLRALAGRVCALRERYRATAPAATPERRRHVKARKAAQIEALAERVAQFDAPARVVDLGSGHGHLTRALAERLARSALGVERERAHVARARTLGGAEFVHADARNVDLRPDDLVVGLHACGALGDALVARARADAAHVLLVSCCFQKIAAPARSWLSLRAADQPPIPREVLGLANLSPVSFRGSESLAAKREARRTRLALRLALASRGVDLRPGDEARGITKERFARGLRAAAEGAFERRGLTPPSELELSHAEAAAARTHACVARYALPRHALARVLEIAIVLDRAQHLVEGAWTVEVSAVFPRSVSPRNLGILASRAVETRRRPGSP